MLEYTKAGNLAGHETGETEALVRSCPAVQLSRGYSRAQQQAPENPEDDKRIGLWLDQGVSTPLAPDKSLDVEFHERFDEGWTNLYEYFFQGRVAFRLPPWFTLIPIYRCQRFPGNPSIASENRGQLNLTLSTSRGPWRYNLRTLLGGRFPDDRAASARLRFRPGVGYTLPLLVTRRPVLVVSNEFFIVPGYNLEPGYLDSELELLIP